ncbi:MAG: hypothetical protein QM652_11555 [Legionella sp.]|uniref:hypothetical protein n=1 Tax=Legionella sp. TaxID=459 RepID=UPI0039E6C77C
MPEPSISAVLNNCGLHIITPELRQAIKQRATQPNQPNSVAYNRLLETFIRYYGLRPPFNWSNLDQLLDAYPNAFDMQMIFGPVLRLFLNESLQACDEDERVNFGIENINQLTMLDVATARYASLGSDIIYAYIAKPLGFAIHYFQGGQEQKLQNNETSVISMFHSGGVEGAQAGGHWERTPDPQNRTQDQMHDSSHLAMYVPLLGDSYYPTQIGLSLLKRHVQLMHQQAETAQFTILAKTIAQLDKFLYNSNHVPFSVAIDLLGELTEESRRYINELSSQLTNVAEVSNAFIELLYNHLPAERSSKSISCQTPSGEEPAFEAPIYDLALTLLAPVVVHKIPSIDRQVTDQDSIRPLTANELSHFEESLVSRIVSEKDFSTALYNVCNQQNISRELSDNFLLYLKSDIDFENKASDFLKARVTFIVRKTQIQKKFCASLNLLDERISPDTQKETAAYKKGKEAYNNLLKAQQEFFDGLTPKTSLENIRENIANFRKICDQNVKEADRIMGYGWLYRVHEVLRKAVAALYAGIGMVLGIIGGQGLMDPEKRQEYKKTFLTLDQTEKNKALKEFKQAVLGENEDDPGLIDEELLAPQNLYRW